MDKLICYGICLKLWIGILRNNVVYNEMSISVFIIFIVVIYYNCYMVF